MGSLILEKRVAETSEARRESGHRRASVVGSVGEVVEDFFSCREIHKFSTVHPQLFHRRRSRGFAGKLAGTKHGRFYPSRGSNGVRAAGAGAHCHGPAGGEPRPVPRVPGGWARAVELRRMGPARRSRDLLDADAAVARTGGTPTRHDSFAAG